MALVAATIKATVMAALAAKGFTITASDKNYEFMEVIVDEIVTAITTTAVVTTVTSCSSGAGTGAGIST